MAVYAHTTFCMFCVPTSTSLPASFCTQALRPFCVCTQ
ncbi:unnamed protein product [Ectocarpus sp. 8 AP-2014]